MPRLKSAAVTGVLCLVVAACGTEESVVRPSPSVATTTDGTPTQTRTPPPPPPPPPEDVTPTELSPG
jgi:hypothetical protein